MNLAHSLRTSIIAPVPPPLYPFHLPADHSIDLLAPAHLLVEAGRAHSAFARNSGPGIDGQDTFRPDASWLVVESEPVAAPRKQASAQAVRPTLPGRVRAPGAAAQCVIEKRIRDHSCLAEYPLHAPDFHPLTEGLTV